jgi:four helix bundle protein
MLHEKLNCYQKSLTLADELNSISSRLPRGYGYLADQIKRAISSVVLNCAEGNARKGSQDRIRFFNIARASLSEVGACLDLLKIFTLIKPEQHNTLKGTAYQVSYALHRLR